MAHAEERIGRMAAGAQVRREVLGAAYVDGGTKSVDAFSKHFVDFTEDFC